MIDRPVDQVLIEARIVIATETFARELGARFGISGNKDNAYFNGNLEPTRPQSMQPHDLRMPTAMAARTSAGRLPPIRRSRPRARSPAA